MRPFLIRQASRPWAGHMNPISILFPDVRCDFMRVAGVIKIELISLATQVPAENCRERCRLCKLHIICFWEAILGGS